MAAAQHDFTAEQGADFVETVTWREPNGDLVNLSGYSARMMVRETYTSAEPLLSLDDGSGGGITLGGAAGTIALHVDAETMADIEVPAPQQQRQGIPTRTLVYDLELVEPGGRVWRLIEGKFFVKAEVTR